MMDKNHLFRAYDIRGIYGKEINSIMMYKLGVAIAEVAKSEFKIDEIQVYVGYDIRQTSQLLAFSFVTGLTSAGLNVLFSNQPFPFGVIMYSGLVSKANFTAFITASNLTPDWNGIKNYYGDGVGFSELKISEIRDMYNKINIDNLSLAGWDEISSIKVKEYFLKYVSFFKEQFYLNTSLRVAIDCGNGSACLSAPLILKECNYTIIEQWCEVDPTFPNRSSEPTAESLKKLCNLIKSNDSRVDFGVGFDGDGDRAVIIDDKGDLVPADIIAILLSKFLKEKLEISDPIVLANIECSSAIEKSLKPDFKIKRIPVGHTFLTLEARTHKENCVLGVESSGHFVFPQYFLFDDALLVPLFVGQMLQMKNERLSDLVKKIPQLYSIRKTFKCSDHTKFQVIQNVMAHVKEKFSNVNTIDGIAINLEDSSYVLIRASNTGPKIRLYIESDNEMKLARWEDEFSDFLEKKIQEINKI
jgi:phosphomannomutase